MPDTEQQPLQEEKRVFLTQEEWRALWEREYTILFQVAKGILGNEDDAKDAVHDAFASFDRSVRHGRDIELREKTLEKAARDYLVRVVRNHAVNILRQRHRWRETGGLTDDIAEGLNLEIGALSPEEELLLRSLLDEVCQRVEKLPPRLKKLFLFFLNYLDNDPDEHWPLWAAENGFDPESRTQRNSHFDQPKHLLRERLIALGIYELLGGKE